MSNAATVIYSAPCHLVDAKPTECSEGGKSLCSEGGEGALTDVCVSVASGGVSVCRACLALVITRVGHSTCGKS